MNGSIIMKEISNILQHSLVPVQIMSMGINIE